MRIGFEIYTVVLISFIALGNSNLKSEISIDSYCNSNTVLTGEYFPADHNKVLIYESDFGETHLSISKESCYDVFTFKSDDFTYIQKLLINKDGVFVKETYQKMKLLLVISDEGTFTYSEPLPRIKFPLNSGNHWTWQGKEYNEDETNSISLIANVEKNEGIKVAAGFYETIKLVTKITSSAGTNSTITEWFAKDIGLIKMTM